MGLPAAEWVRLLAGLGLLVAGAEALVGGAGRIARSFGIRPIVIGLTIVAFGTSAPEAVVSLLAALRSEPDIAAGNVVGSNIFNVAFILGIAALIQPLKVEESSVRREVPFVIGSAVLLGLLGLDGRIGRVDGVLLLAAFAFFVRRTFHWSRDKRDDEGEPAPGSKAVPLALALLGLALLVAGARLFVEASVSLARAWGVSELFIGLTIVAAGTSLPELATSVVGALRKHDDIAVGNVTGSNIFNVLFILGLAALIEPVAFSRPLLARDTPWMLALSLVLVPIMRTGSRISRAEGGLLVASYGGYVWWLARG